MSNKAKYVADGVGTFEEYLSAINAKDAGLSKEVIASIIDHTLLKPNAKSEEIEHLCDEAAKYKFKSVCVNPFWIPLAAQKLKGTGVKVCTVVGFPLGANSSKVKAFETSDAIAMGADEIDMVINIGALKSGDIKTVEEDMKAVVEAANGKALTKVIIESCLLTDNEKKMACELASRAGLDYVKTSTGFSTGGATAADIKLMRETVGDRLGVKASGGVRNLKDVETMVANGATRIGASAGIAIIEGKEAEGNY